jgi:L-asparaginase II
VAIACASHHAEPAQLDAVRKVLARAGATVDDLENGLQECRPEGKLGHNCSGKHAGMLAACHARTAGRCIPTATRRIRCSSASPSCSAAARRRSTAAGCRPLPRRCAAPRSCSRAHPSGSAARCAPVPELVGASAGSTDTDLMRLRDGWIAKGGRGLFCAAHEDGRGYAFKAEDGASRALRAAVGQVLAIEEFLETPVSNSRGEVVGSIA